MPSDTKDNEKAAHLSEEEKKVVMVRCFRMVDYLCDIVTDYILNFLQDVPCSTAKQFLLSRPEEFAIRAFIKTINDIAHPSPKPKNRMH
jgi:hypothetical protein